MENVGFLEKKFIEQDNKGKQLFFVMKKVLFKGIENAFEEKIIEMQSTGVNIEQLTGHVNRKLC